MHEMIAVANNPFATLYVLQAATYAAAAALSIHGGHRDLSVCYGLSAILHAAFATCHMHFV